MRKTYPSEQIGREKNLEEIEIIQGEEKNNINKDIKRKKMQINFLRHINTKIFSKILTKLIQQHTEWVIYHDQLKSIPGMQGCFNILKLVDGFATLTD